MKKKCMMVVTAHPDDADFGCSATVAKFSRKGWDVVYVICTDGSKGTEDRTITPKELSKIRYEEQKNSGIVLGLKDVIFLNYPDGYLEPTLEVRKDISRQIRIWKPEILITTNPTRDLNNSTYLGHPDHFAAGEATLSAVFPSARDHLTFPDLFEKEKLEPHKVKEVWIMSYGEKADFWNPVTELDVDTSIEALLKHVSQIPDPESAASWMKKRRQDLGKNIDSDYAESFKKFVMN